jgi:hypothetical protein
MNEFISLLDKWQVDYKVYTGDDNLGFKEEYPSVKTRVEVETDSIILGLDHHDSGE